MKNFKQLLQLLIVAGIAWAAWFFLFPPPEKVIEKRLRKLAATVSDNPKGNIAIIGNVNAIAGFFHPEANLQLEGFGRNVDNITGRKEIQQMALGARQNVGSIRVEFFNIETVVDPTKTNATVLLTAIVKLGDQTEPMAQNLRVQMQKVEKSWVVASASAVRDQLQVP